MTLLLPLVEAIKALRPGAQYSMLDGTNLNTLTWLDTVQTRPTNQEILDKVVAMEQAEAANNIRKESIMGSADRIDLINRLRTASNAQIDNWVDTNVTSIAAARAVLKAIIKVIAFDIRN